MYPFSPHLEISVITRPKLSGGGDHWGVQLPNGMVAHSNSEKGPHFATFEEFAAGKPVREIRKISSSEYWATVQRINNEIANPSKYHLLENNCETFANRVTGGLSESRQVKGWMFTAAAIGIIALAANG